MKAALQDCSAALTHLEPEKCRQSYVSAVGNLGSALEQISDEPEALQAALIQLQKARSVGQYDPESLASFKLLWSEGRVLQKLGKLMAAESAFRQAQTGLISNGTLFEASVVGLDLAGLLFEQGRFDEVARIAAEMFPILRALRVHREVYGALILFHKSAMTRTLTPAILERIRQIVRNHGPALS